jgi:hypothetical protein
MLPLRLAHVETPLAVARFPRPLEGLSASSQGSPRRTFLALEYVLYWQLLRFAVSPASSIEIL